MVSVLTFQSNDPSSNPAEAFTFSAKFVLEKNDNTQEAGVGILFKKFGICQSYLSVFTNKKSVI